MLDVGLYSYDILRIYCSLCLLFISKFCIFVSRLVDYLDEALPGSFRQAQVSFSSLIPKAMPTCDAVTMEPFIWLYCDYGRLKLSSLLESEDSGTDSVTESRYRVSPAFTANAMGRNSAGRSDNMLTPNVLMLTKHTNGSLNLWQVIGNALYFIKLRPWLRVK